MPSVFISLIHYRFTVSISLDPRSFTIYSPNLKSPERKFGIARRKPYSRLDPPSMNKRLETFASYFQHVEQATSDVIQPPLNFSSTLQSPRRVARSNLLRHSTILTQYSGSPPYLPLPGLPEGKYAGMTSQNGMRCAA